MVDSESNPRGTPEDGPAGVRVLLVDDNATFLRIVARFLGEHEGIVVVGTLDRAEEALARVAALRPDVVLIDLSMPGLSGLDAIPRLRGARPDASIIAVTMFDADPYRRAALAAGADAFVPKATVSAELIPTIRRLASNRAAGSPPRGRGPSSPCQG